MRSPLAVSERLVASAPRRAWGASRRMQEMPSTRVEEAVCAVRISVWCKSNRERLARGCSRRASRREPSCADSSSRHRIHDNDPKEILRRLDRLGPAPKVDADIPYKPTTLGVPVRPRAADAPSRENDALSDARPPTRVLPRRPSPRASEAPTTSSSRTRSRPNASSTWTRRPRAPSTSPSSWRQPPGPRRPTSTASGPLPRGVRLPRALDARRASLVIEEPALLDARRASDKMSHDSSTRVEGAS